MFADYKKIKALNDTNRRLYNYMIDHTDEVIDMNVRQFADANFVTQRLLYVLVVPWDMMALRN